MSSSTQVYNWVPVNLASESIQQQKHSICIPNYQWYCTQQRENKRQKKKKYKNKVEKFLYLLIHFLMQN